MDQNWCKHRNMFGLGNSHGNFQLHRFTTSENIAKSFREEATFLTLTVHLISLEVQRKCPVLNVQSVDPYAQH